MLRIKIIEKRCIAELEKEIEKFVEHKCIKDIKYQTTSIVGGDYGTSTIVKYSAMIIYEDAEYYKDKIDNLQKKLEREEIKNIVIDERIANEKQQQDSIERVKNMTASDMYKILERI